MMIRLRAGRPGFDSHQGEGFLSLCCGVHSASYSMGTGGSLPGGKAAGA
jgi:hypothetical protein